MRRESTYLLYSYGELYELTVEESENSIRVELHSIPPCRDPIFVYSLSLRSNLDSLDILATWTSLYTCDGELIEQFLDDLQELLEDAAVIAEKVQEHGESHG